MATVFLSAGGDFMRVEPLHGYVLTISYATPSDLFPGVATKKDTPSVLEARWLISGTIPTTVDEAMDPAFQAGISNETVAGFLEAQPGAPVLRGQLVFLAAKIRAMPGDISDALYLMDQGNTVLGSDWEYDPELGIARAKFPFRGHMIFVRLERMPIHALIPVLVE